MSGTNAPLYEAEVDTRVPPEEQERLWQHWLEFGPGHGEPRARTLWDSDTTSWDSNETIWPT